jgi:hypothetical protein
MVILTIIKAGTPKLALKRKMFVGKTEKDAESTYGSSKGSWVKSCALKRSVSIKKTIMMSFL